MAEPANAATVSGYLDTLPSNAPSGTLRDEVIDAILKTCRVFSPSAAVSPGWDEKYCWAHLASAIKKESGYNPALVVKDAYGERTIGAAKANDPTVGLLQIRFSSTVRDYTVEGVRSALSCIGCNLPAPFDAQKNQQGDSTFWAVNGPSANMSLMQSTACNVGLGTWYYYISATGNGKASAPTYTTPYCNGQGTAGNLVTGLLSHLKGPGGGKGVIPNMAGVNALQTSDNNAYQYITQIKTSFDTMVGAVAGTHPFFVTLNPDTAMYCEP